MCIGSVVCGVWVCVCVGGCVCILRDSQNRLNQPFRAGDNLEIVEYIERCNF